ncbi:helix-turn-helix domain-containing protein [Spirosoma sp. KUDC1026]|uniref:helix-turn-helix domain-containing protein n=1 Tax=Spirosoma sp. KUDC1026 TaxID=2745947 RepID=UPI00159BD82F|nr:helix-turn-helix domain-containing protein [Spirosoma sp. KUDC1026]QKZ12351.1 helix-turn-helix domain containing protein [Spirosoma sp. KUDC1026]QKZ14980.1 helix-turn-helix domain containing protein [Spirosoma sp. KUDC1026]
MGKPRTIELQPAERQALEQAFRSDTSHAFRQRCQIVLFKSEGRTSKEVAQLVKQHYVSVNAWLNRYQQAGLNGLRTKPGRGRKALLDKQTDATLVRQVVQNERQRLNQAKAQIESRTGRSMSLKTLQRFLKNLTVLTDASD